MASGKWAGSTRKATLPPGWWRLRASVLRRDNHTCRIQDPGCIGRATEVDHVHGRDDHTPGNLRAACKPCHQRRSSGQGGTAAGAAARARRVSRFRPAEAHPGLLPASGDSPPASGRPAPGTRRTPRAAPAPPPPATRRSD